MNWHPAFHIRSRGFTLVELIVSVGLFAIVMLVAAGAYLVVINLNRGAQAYATNINNLAFSLEAMVRDIRTGTQYQCISGVPTNCQQLRFVNWQGHAVSYGLGAAGSPVGNVYNYIQRLDTNDSTASGSVTDSSQINITNLTFYLSGIYPTPGSTLGPSDALQPHVTIIIQGEVFLAPGKKQSFSIETGATMRGTDLGV